MDSSEESYNLSVVSLLMQILLAMNTNRDRMQHILGWTAHASGEIEKISQFMSRLSKKVQLGSTTLGRSAEVLGQLPLQEGAFTHSLKLASQIPPTLHKGKIFTIKIRLASRSGLILHEEDSFNLTAEVYSSENPPQLITCNRKGRPIVEIDSHSDAIQYHPRKKCHFAYIRLRFSDVTSHYPNSWVFLVFRPKFHLQQVNVKPIVIPHFKIRAKAPKNEVLAQVHS